MPTDYKKLRELCPELEKKEDDLRKTIVPEIVSRSILDTTSVIAHEALQAQPELAEQQRRADEAKRSAHARAT